MVSELGFGGAPAGLRNYLGAWEPDEDEAAQKVVNAIDQAVSLGINYFDTAPGYGQGASERMFGRGIKPHREQLVIATKLFAADADDVRHSIESSLKNLQTGWLDVIQLHGTWYSDRQVDQILSPGGALDGLLAVKKDGLVRQIGFTTEGANGPASRLIATGAFDVLQVCYNMIYQHPYDPTRQSGLLYEAEANNMGVIIMRSLTSGIFQKWLAGVFPRELGNRVLQDRLNQALLSFVLSNPLVDCALIGMRTVDEVIQNVNFSQDHQFRFDLDEIHERYV
jgi:aryl-alcohol dehydrogenase-like predicted oxidoreductase